MYDIETGASRHAFRALPQHVSDADAFRCPQLEAVEIYSDPVTRRLRPRVDASWHEASGQGPQADAGIGEPARRQIAMRGIACPLGVRESGHGLRHVGLITAGDDRQIRFWDLGTPGDSYTVSGLEAGYSQPKYGAAGGGEVFYCQSTEPAGSFGSGSPAVERRGPVPPSSNHDTAILALELLPLSQRPLLLSGSRDGAVRVWC